MLRSFIGTCHGKGEHDGASAVVKQALQAKQLNAHGHLMQNPEDVHSSSNQN
jgi:hypothetical protein